MQAATDMVTKMMAPGCPVNRLETSNDDSSGAARSHHAIVSEKVAHIVAMRLKDIDKKFSGNLEQSWMEYVDECLHIFLDYHLNPVQKFQLLHSALTGHAKRCYLDSVDGFATSYQRTVEIIEKGYN